MILRNKLILSCAALAAVATTAVSTTFAWYTANTDVNAKGLTASTESIDDATLLISLDNYNWSSNVDLTSIFANSNKLKPVQYGHYIKAATQPTTAAEFAEDVYYTRTGAGTDESPYVYAKAASFAAGTDYYVIDLTTDTTKGSRDAIINLWNQETNTIGNEATANTDYIRFTLFFKSASSSSINVKNTKFTFKNATDSFDEKIKLSTVGNPSSTSTYTVDLMRALVVDVDVQNGHEAATDGTAEEGFTKGEFGDVLHKSYSANAYASADKRDTVGESEAATWNAHKYYNAVKNLNSYQKKSEFDADIAAANGYYTKIANPYVVDNTVTASTFSTGTYFTVKDNVYSKATSFAAGTTYYKADKNYTLVEAENQPNSQETLAAGTYYLENDSEATTYTAGVKYYVRQLKDLVLSNETQPTSANFAQAAYYVWTDGINETLVSSESTQLSLTTAVNQFASANIGSTGEGSTTLGQAGVLAVTYTIYLDGWDKFCFNGVQGQTITLDLEYQGALA